MLPRSSLPVLVYSCSKITFDIGFPTFPVQFRKDIMSEQSQNKLAKLSKYLLNLIQPKSKTFLPLVQKIQENVKMRIFIHYIIVFRIHM